MKIKPYLEIRRPDHWFKNLSNLPGILLCLFFYRVPPRALSLRGPVAAGNAGQLLEVDLGGVGAGEDRLRPE